MKPPGKTDYTTRELAQLIRRKMIQKSHGPGKEYIRDKQSWVKDL
jgi:hypothetical protein